MKVIDLLNKIANDEEVPNKIIYADKEFEYIEGAYEDKKGNDLCKNHYSCSIFLNDEIEIIEEKKIPIKLNKNEFLHNKTLEQVDADLDFIIDTLNEIIDCLDYLKSKGE